MSDYLITSGPFSGVTYTQDKEAVENAAAHVWPNILSPKAEISVPFYTKLSSFPQVCAGTFMEFMANLEICLGALHKREILLDDFEWCEYKDKTMAELSYDIHRFCRKVH